MIKYCLAIGRRKIFLRQMSPALHGFIQYANRSRSAASSSPASNPSDISEIGKPVSFAFTDVHAQDIVTFFTC